MNNKDFNAKDVVFLYKQLEDQGINIWIDGGWGVDALLGEQTRPHSDLDIVIEQYNMLKLRNFLYSQSYNEVERDDSSAWNFVLADDQGHEVDVHVIEFDSAGNGIYGSKELGMQYPANSLTGVGRIGELAVKCLTANYQVVSHTGYEVRPKDISDVFKLCDRFGIKLPSEYEIK